MFKRRKTVKMFPPGGDGCETHRILIFPGCRVLSLISDKFALFYGSFFLFSDVKLMHPAQPIFPGDFSLPSVSTVEC